MKKTISSLLFIVVITLQLTAQDDVSQSRWQPVKIITDGDNSEWNRPLNLYDAATGLLFTITNDNKALYLCFTANDERKINKLMKAGWSIELSSKEKKKKFNATIVFPAITMTAPVPVQKDVITNIARPDLKNTTALYKMDLTGVNTRGFTIGDKDIPLLNNDGINIAVGSDSTQSIIFELAIPFKELLAEDKLLLNEEMTLAITVNGLERPAHEGNHANNATPGSFGNGGGRMGGGRRGGFNTQKTDNNNYPERNLMFEKISFKQKFRLVNQ